jgi:2-oxoglutarate dehydrogenase E2 component (dihydrolipoamide succinyltransferase)
MSIEVIMPQMGESITEGTLTKWLKQVGDSVDRDEDLFEISTDKVDTVVPAPSSGVLKEIVVKEGETVPINTVVCVLEATGADAGEAKASPPPKAASAESQPSAPEEAASRPEAPAAAQAPAAAATAGAKAAASAPAGEPARVRSSPLVRRIAREHGVDLSQLTGSGSAGRITKADILAQIEAGRGVEPSAPAQTPRPAVKPAPPISMPAGPAMAPGAEVHVEPMSTMRKRIAEHMVVSRRTSAHVTTVFEIDMQRVSELRQSHKQAFAERHNTRLTYTAFIAAATVEALTAFPLLNASLDGDNIIYHRNVNLGIAVALDWGLIVPVIKRADSLNLVGLARAINDLGERARDKKLEPTDVQDGTFTITNPGIYGGMFGTPIINQPQVAILGVGTVEKRPVVLGNDAIGIRPRAYFGLSFDHRLVDGAVADQFMAHLKSRLESFENWPPCLASFGPERRD